MASNESNHMLAPGRSCGDCSLCCKLLRIDAFNKPNGKWCAHCAPGRGGCKIYETRPDECRAFYCLWLISPHIAAEWQPNKCKMVLSVESDGHRIALHVDPANPTAWRHEPFFSQLRKWALSGPDSQQQVVIYIGKRVIALLPGKEVDLGIVKSGDHIMIGLRAGIWEAFVRPAKDIAPEDAHRWITQ
jgi:hypothetical protein